MRSFAIILALALCLNPTWAQRVKGMGMGMGNGMSMGMTMNSMGGVVSTPQPSPDTTPDNGPTTMGNGPTTMGNMPTTMGNMPTTMGDMPTTMGNGPSTMDNMPTTMGNGPSTMGNMPTTMGNGPSTMTNGPSTMGNMPTTMGNGPSTMTNGPSTMGNMPTTMGNGPTTMDNGPTTMGNMPTTMGNGPTTMGNGPTTMSNGPTMMPPLEEESKCKDGFSYSNGMCLYFSEMEANYSMAENYCEMKGSSLINPEAVSNQAEYIVDRLQDEGLTNSWMGSEEEEDQCLAVRLNDRFLSVMNKDCEESMKFICAYKMPCEAGWKYADGHCFKVMADPWSYFQSFFQCERNLGHLVAVSSHEIHNVLSEILEEEGITNAWIGADAIRGAYRWVHSGKLVMIDQWAMGQPSSKPFGCVQLFKDGELDYGWRDEPCHMLARPICAIPVME